MAGRYEIMKVDEDKNFIQYTSPSVILGQLSKGDGLMQWGVNEGISSIKRLAGYDDEGRYIVTDKILDDSRYAWKCKRDNTADIGSDLHKLVETYIHLRLDGADKKKQNEFSVYIKKQNINLRNMFYQFISWSKKHVKQFIESEQTVVDRNLCIAGTLDFIYEDFDGNIYCVDLKTSNAIYQTHEIQVVVYKNMRESMGGKYIVKSSYGPIYNKTMDVKKIKINKCAILEISRDFFYLEYKIIKDEEHKQRSFEAILAYYYISAARKLNNTRAKERR